MALRRDLVFVPTKPSGPCPLCGDGPALRCNNGGDADSVCCPTCGAFVITGTATAMIAVRADGGTWGEGHAGTVRSLLARQRVASPGDVPVVTSTEIALCDNP